jgi:hypothetical protein
MIHVPEDDLPRPVKQRKTCPHCEATPAGCNSNHWLRARWCCDACDGIHDGDSTERAATA